MALPLSPVIELLINATWTDVSAYVLYDPAILVTFGIQSEGNTADPATAALTFKNHDGRFTPRNTAGPYYPYLTRNTPLRITVGAVVRYYGFIAEFPVRTDETGTFSTVAGTAAGDLRRLARSRVLDSTLVSAVRALYNSTGNITGYWPVEDAVGSTSIASPTGQTPGTFTGAPVFEAFDPGVMSKPIPSWLNARATFYPAVPASSTEFTAGCLVDFPAAGELTGGEELFRVGTSGTLASWRFLYSPGSGGGILLQVINSAGVEVYATVIVTGVDGRTVFLKLECAVSGANTNWAFSALGVGFNSGVLAGSVTAPTYAQIGAGTIGLPDGVGIGHVILGKDDLVISISSFDDGLNAYAGETVNARMLRLASQGGVAMTVTSGLFSPAEMGAQSDGSLIDALREAEKADVGGILRDSLNGPGLTYYTRTARYNDVMASIALDYAAGHLTPPLAPTDDDQQIRNDVTANRLNGSSARVVQTTGPLNTADYPAGVGVYKFEDTYDTYRDDRLPHVAGWILGLGTVDETRWPQITVDLVKNPSLVTAWDLMRPGGTVTVANLPAIYGTTAVPLQVIGWTELISPTHRTVTMNCVPGTPWQVVELDDTVFGKLDEMHLAL
jgi:hypothetical protein